VYAPDLSTAELEAGLERLLATGTIPTAYGGTRADLAALKDMTSRLIGRFVRVVERATRARHGDGPLTRYGADLVVPDAVRAESSVLKAVAAHFVMFADERVHVMESQRGVVAQLVDCYLSDPSRLDRDLQADFAEAESDAERLRVIVDQVASLTDSRATVLGRAWT